MDVITVAGLTKYYGPLCAVDHIDFDIKKGECFGFLGPNGAGKTTVMGVISCFLPPTAGSVKVFGIGVTEDPSQIKSKIGVMPQDESLDPDLNVLENLIVYARYFDIPKKVSEPLAEELLRFVEIEDKAVAGIRDLSGGMKRRLLLARALINNPELLILDEPTVGLDPYSRHSVWEKMEALKSRGVTLILTTHYMEEAEKICDRVAIMNTGRIVTTDAPMRLMNEYQGSLEDVYLKLTGRPLAA